MYIVELEKGVWLAFCDGDPYRTLVKEDAVIYYSRAGAVVGLEKAKKHMKLFFIYYSNSLNHDNHSAFIPKLEKQHVKTMHYLNKILNSTPQSMKRYSYMTNSISYLNNNMQKYINKKSENTKSF